MHKPTLTLVGTDSLSKVSGYGEFKDFVTFVNCLLIFAPCCHFVFETSFLFWLFFPSSLICFLPVSFIFKKLAFLADNAMYLYHDGTWKFGKVGDLAVDKFDNLLYCTTCGQHYYYTGAHVRISAVIRAGWQCQKCKWCQICRQTNQDDRYLLCDVCDGAFHAHCLRPQMASIPKNGWKCKVISSKIWKTIVF